MKGIDPVNVVTGVLFLLNMLGLYSIKRETSQVNRAVNHVEEGTPTLSDRVDSVNGTLEYTQAVLTVYKKETSQQFEELHKSQDSLRGMVEAVKDDVRKIRESVDRRHIAREK